VSGLGAEVEEEEWAEAEPDPQERISARESLALSVAVHALALVVLAVASLLAPPDDGAGITEERLRAMRALLAASEEQRATPDDGVKRLEDARHASERGSTQPRARSTPTPTPTSTSTPTPTSTSTPTPTPTSTSTPTSTPTPNASPTSIATPTQLAEASAFGLIALARSLKVDPRQEAPWTRALASLDSASHAASTHSYFDNGAITSSGPGGLALSSVGEGGGGKAGPQSAPIAVSIPDMGPPPPVLDHPHTSPMAGLSPATVAVLQSGIGQDAIRRLVHANTGRFRLCYARSLRLHLPVSGRIVVGFTIGEAGIVTGAQDEGGDLDDVAVRECIVRTFYGLTFPPPRSGPVRVKYPFVLTPDE
jgi:hypothetical protein